MEATETDTLRRGNITSKLNKIRNETIKERMGITKTINDCIETAKLIWSRSKNKWGKTSKESNDMDNSENRKKRKKVRGLGA